MWFEQHKPERFEAARDRLTEDRARVDTLIEQLHMEQGEALRLAYEEIFAVTQQCAGPALVFRMRDNSAFIMGPVLDTQIAIDTFEVALDQFAPHALALGQYSATVGIRTSDEYEGNDPEDMDFLAEKMGLPSDFPLFTSRVWVNLRGQVWITHLIRPLYDPGCKFKSVRVYTEQTGIPHGMESPVVGFPSVSGLTILK